MRNLSIYFVFLSLITAGCSNNSSSTNSIEINFQSKGVSGLTISPSDISNLIVNVTGAGISEPLFVKKDCNKQGVSCTSISVDSVPANSKPLVQLMVILKDPSSDDEEAGSVYYGDVSETINGDTQLSITTSQIGSFTNVARFSGVYNTPADHKFPGKQFNGKVDIAAYVGGSKPFMKVSETEIIGGRFDAFLLDTMRFVFLFTGTDREGQSYTSEPILNKVTSGTGLNIGDLDSLYAQKRAQKISYSGDIFYKDSSSNYSSTKKRSYKTHIVATFVNGFSGFPDAKICYDNVTQDYNGTNGYSEICTAVSGSTCTSYLNWSQVTKAMNVDSEACPANFFLKLKPEQLEWTADFNGFFGALKRHDHSDNQLLNYANGAMTFRSQNGFDIPGGIVDVYTKNDSSFNRDLIKSDDVDGGIECSQLIQNGFSLRNASVTKNGPSYTFTPSLAEKIALLNKSLNIALCPRLNGKYFKKALLFQAYQIPAVTKIGLRKIIASSETYINRDACVPLMVELFNELDQVGYSENDVQVNLGLTGSIDGDGAFYTDQSCSTSVSSVNLKDRKVIFFKATTSAVDGSLTAVDNDGSLANADLVISNVNLGSTASNFKVIPDFNRTSMDVATTETCAPFMGVFLDSNGEPALGGTGDTLVIKGSLNSTTGASRFSKDNCSTLTTSYSYVSSAQFVPLQLHNTSNIYSAGGNIAFEFPTCPGPNSCESTTLNLVSPGVFDHFHAEVVNPQISYTQDSCIEIKIGSYDSHKPNSYPTNFPNNNTIGISKTSGTFHADIGDCGGGDTIPSLNADTTKTHKTFFFKTSTLGPARVTIFYDGEFKIIDLNIISV